MRFFTPATRAAVAALLALPLACAAAPQESPLPAGMKGRLQLSIEVANGNKLERSMRMELNMVSTETAPAHLLIDPLDEDARRQQAHLDKAGSVLADKMANRKPDPDLSADLDSCEKNQAGARCVRALRALQEQHDSMQALGAGFDAAPEWTSQHRYQGWGSDFAKGCGTVVAQIHGAKPVQLRLPIDDSEEARIFTCGTTFAIDRRARTAVLSIKPGNLEFPGPAARKGPSLLNYADFAKSSGVEGKRMANALVLHGLSAGADGATIVGSRSVRSAGGSTTSVRWKFVPQS